MPDKFLMCISCGSSFKWSKREQERASKEAGPGKHAPADCPEGMDTFCPNCDTEMEGPEECPTCRPKQDMQRG